MDMAAVEVIKQHLIDPEICIRCNTCEETCPVDAITHDARNYVVDADDLQRCAWPASRRARPARSTTGARCRRRRRTRSRSSCSGTRCRPSVSCRTATLPPASDDAAARRGAAGSRSSTAGEAPFSASSFGATMPPWSAAHAVHQSVRPEEPDHRDGRRQLPRDRGRLRESDTHHIVLDFGAMPFPVLEGQSIGILPPGVDANGRPHYARQYSIASPRDGERPGYNNVSLTVKRVTEDHQGTPVRGVCSNYLCDLEGRRRRAGDRPVRHDVPDAEPSALEHPDDLHRHRLGADARDDRMAAPAARSGQVRRRQADAVLRRAHAAGAAVLRPAAEPAEGLHRHQPRVLAHAGPAASATCRT